MKNALWFVLAVSLGLFAYSLTAIIVNGFRAHMLYPLILGVINIAAFFMLKR